jgi:hypothetical protein
MRPLLESAFVYSASMYCNPDSTITADARMENAAVIAYLLETQISHLHLSEAQALRKRQAMLWLISLTATLHTGVNRFGRQGEYHEQANAHVTLGTI